MILVIDTSSPGIGLCYSPSLAKGCPKGGVVVKKFATDKQSLDLPGAVEKFIDSKWRNITAVAVVVGPGSFTGIRLGIAYAKGVSLGLGIPCVAVNAFEIYLEKNPNAFVAIDSGKGDFFVASKIHKPRVMTIDELEIEQMKCPETVGHNPYDLSDTLPVAMLKLSAPIEPVIPMYLKPSYAEKNI